MFWSSSRMISRRERRIYIGSMSIMYDCHAENTRLLAVVRSENRERGHCVNGEWLRDGGGERLRKERNAALSLAARGEELAAKRLVTLRDEERGRAETAAAVLSDVDLVVQKLLHMLDGEEVLAVHRDDDSVPYLRDEDLGETVRYASLLQFSGFPTLGLYLTSISPVANNFAYILFGNRV